MSWNRLGATSHQALKVICQLNWIGIRNNEVWTGLGSATTSLVLQLQNFQCDASLIDRLFGQSQLPHLTTFIGMKWQMA